MLLRIIIMVVFAVDCVACKTVSQLFYLCFGGLRFDLVCSTNCECVIRPQVTLYN